MNQYFFKVTADYWCPKNDLQKEAKEVARQMDQVLVSEYQVDGFVEVNLYAKITSLNVQHHRCKPLRIEVASSYTRSETEESFIIPGVFVLTRYLVKNEQ